MINQALALLLVLYAFLKVVTAGSNKKTYKAIAATIAAIIIVFNYTTIITIPASEKELLPFFILLKNVYGRILMIDFSQIIVIVELASNKNVLHMTYTKTIRYIKMLRSKHLLQKPR